MFNERLVILLQQIRELLLSKRFDFVEEYRNDLTDRDRDVKIQIMTMIDESLDILKNRDNDFQYNNDYISRHSIFEYFFEKTEIIFHDLRKEPSYKKFLELYNQIEQIYIFCLSRINNSQVDKQLYKIQDNISNLKKTVSNLAPIDFIKEKENINKTLEQLNTKKVETEQILKYIKDKKNTADILTSELAYSKNAIKYIVFAKANRKSARSLFWFSIIIMGLVALFSLIIFWHIPVMEIKDIKILWLRFPILLVVLMPAFFMMRESKKLKDKEFQYHDMACRIVTSAPYIDGLSISDEEKGKLKADLVKDFFGKPIECLDDGGAMPLSEIQKFVDSCAKLKK